MVPRYRYGLLDPRPDPVAEITNAALLQAPTLGIEVTVPSLAARCSLGNLDPQHRPEGGALAAIEAALDCPVPPSGSRLVTIRPDADAYGAMAVLYLRAVEVPLTPPMQARIGLIARHDRFDHGPWPGPMPLPCRSEEIDEVGPGTADLGSLIGGLSDPGLVPAAGVRLVRRWIATGTVPSEWRARALAARQALFVALQTGRMRVEMTVPSGIVIVDGFAPGALRLGYRCAPVVVGIDDRCRGVPAQHWRRVTVAQWQAGHVDLMRAAALLAADEPGWGGSPTIIGSPQGVSCVTPTARILEVLGRCRA